MMTSRFSRFSAQSFEMPIMGFRTCVHNNERVGICVVLCCVTIKRKVRISVLVNRRSHELILP
jgi:hypothetical protein